jgi:hypothetical protein
MQSTSTEYSSICWFEFLPFSARDVADDADVGAATAPPAAGNGIDDGENGENDEDDEDDDDDDDDDEKFAVALEAKPLAAAVAVAVAAAERTNCLAPHSSMMAATRCCRSARKSKAASSEATALPSHERHPKSGDDVESPCTSCG